MKLAPRLALSTLMRGAEVYPVPPLVTSTAEIAPLLIIATAVALIVGAPPINVILGGSLYPPLALLTSILSTYIEAFEKLTFGTAVGLSMPMSTEEF